ESTGLKPDKVIERRSKIPGRGLSSMTRIGFASRLAIAASAVALAATGLSGAAAQSRPADLEALPPVPTDYDPPKTAWGDWDFSNTYQIEYLNNTRILFQRPTEYGN